MKQIITTKAKQTISIILIIIAILTTWLFFPVQAQSQNLLPDDFFCRSTLTDVVENTETCFFINFLDYNRVITGYSDLTYREDEFVTRGQFAKFIANAFSITADTSNLAEEDRFPDVPEDNVFYSYIHALKVNGVISGYTDGLFRPGENVTREQVTKYLANSITNLDSNLWPAERVHSFADVPAENVFTDYLAGLHSISAEKSYFSQILDVSTSEYRPADFITRGEFTKMVANTMLYADTGRKSGIPGLEEAIDNIQADKVYYHGEITVYEYEDLGMNIIKTTGEFEFFYQEINVTQFAAEIAEENDYDFFVTGSYPGHFLRERPITDVLDQNIDYGRVIGTESSLNVRLEPSVDGGEDTIIGNIPEGHVFIIEDENEEWFEIEWDAENNDEAWISKEYSRRIDWENDTDTYYWTPHAGWLNLYGEHKFPLKTPEEDMQVTHIVRYDTLLDQVTIHERDNFQPKSEGNDRFLEFQTGPLMVQNNRLEREHIFNSKDGRTKRERSTMGISNNGKTKYFITTSIPYSQNELSHVLMYTAVLDGENVSLISLDGGNSTFFYSKDHPNLNYETSRRKPLGIGLRY